MRLAAFLQAYGPGYPFALFWVQTDDSGRMTAALSRVDGQVTVCACEQADLEEVWAFLSAAGYESVLCPAWVAQASSTRGVCRMESCHAMRLSGVPAVPEICEPAAICKEPSLRQVYELLRAAGEPLPQWEAWLPDVSHRVRHGAAAYGHCRRGKVILPAQWLLPSRHKRRCSAAWRFCRKSVEGGLAPIWPPPFAVRFHRRAGPFIYSAGRACTSSFMNGWALHHMARPQ